MNQGIADRFTPYCNIEHTWVGKTVEMKSKAQAELDLHNEEHR